MEQNKRNENKIGVFVWGAAMRPLYIIYNSIIDSICFKNILKSS